MQPQTPQFVTTRILSILALVLMIAPSGSGCGDAPQSVGHISQALFANDKTAYDFFVGKGLTSFQSAGIVGNLDQESGVDPTAVQGGGPGRGIAQWSVGGRWDTSANDNVLWYAGQKGQPALSLGLQLEFIWYELTSIGYGFAKLKATGNVTDATIVFENDYEICGACNQAQRIANAQAVLNAYGAAPNYAAKYVSQSWPLANMALTVRCGEDVPASLVLRNVGAKAWDTNTKLGTTQARDRASIFVAPDWLAPNRPSHATAAVAPNATFQFHFTFHGPTGKGCVPGDYHEFFNLVQDGVAWFSDQGQGGPPDNQIEAWIKLVPAPEQPDMAQAAPSDMAGAAPGDLRRGEDLAGHGNDGGLVESDLGAGGQGGGGAVQGGCSTGGGGRTSPFATIIGLFLAGLWRRRGRSRRRMRGI